MKKYKRDDLFEGRRKKGLALQDYLIKYLDDNKIGYFLTGYEGLTQYNNAGLNIIRNDSNTSRFVRFYPDITLSMKKDSFLLEIKNSSGIEKDCWNIYKTLSERIGVNVMFLLKDRRIYNIKDLVFMKAKSYDRISNMNIPIEDGIWRSPRLLPDHLYHQYLAAYNGRTSGSSFAFIDFDRSKGYGIETLLLINKKYA